MLGRLARWLRLLGYDAAYLSDTDDLAVVRLARAEGRTILTRDTGLVARRGVDAILIESQDLDPQIEQVIREIGPPPEPIMPRCMACNVPLIDLAPEAAAGRVPPYVLRMHDAFTECPHCHRVYWEGTHWQAIHARLADHGEEG
jgi:uncharacterized protein with PIN domain